MTGAAQQQTGPQFPKSADNPTGYTTDERDRRLKKKDPEGVRGRKDNGQEAGHLARGAGSVAVSDLNRTTNQ